MVATYVSVTMAITAKKSYIWKNVVFFFRKYVKIKWFIHFRKAWLPPCKSILTEYFIFLLHTYLYFIYCFVLLNLEVKKSWEVLSSLPMRSVFWNEKIIKVLFVLVLFIIIFFFICGEKKTSVFMYSCNLAIKTLYTLLMSWGINHKTEYVFKNRRAALPFLQKTRKTFLFWLQFISNFAKKKRKHNFSMFLQCLKWHKAEKKRFVLQLRWKQKKMKK